MHQAIEGDRGRYLTLHEGIDFTDVAHHDRDEAQRSAGVAPGESRRHADLATVADA
jgi:hypothetical protein